MDKRITVITGSASGIGLAAAEHLRKSGHKVIGIDLANADIIADLSEKNGRDKAIDQALELSGGHVHHLVTCAGLGGQAPDKRKILAVNYFGTVDLLDGLFPALKNADSASVVTVGSNAASFRDFSDNEIVAALLNGDLDQADTLLPHEMTPLAYGLSKNAVIRAMRRRAGEWGGAGVRINAIVPGQTRTPLYQGVLDHPVLGPYAKQIKVPLGRIAEPEEMAKYIAILLGPESAFMHGSVLWADGGTDAATRPDNF